uniref:Uncharacterized protein n=1 Tax=Anguilla anguilla TaxID=7936 RepID=A0A0E9XWP0_ANGAN
MRFSIGIFSSMRLYEDLMHRVCVLGYSLSDTKKCVQAGTKVGINIQGVYVSLGAEGGSCKGLLKELGGKALLLCIYAL